MKIYDVDYVCEIMKYRPELFHKKIVKQKITVNGEFWTYEVDGQTVEKTDAEDYLNSAVIDERKYGKEKALKLLKYALSGDKKFLK